MQTAASQSFTEGGWTAPTISTQACSGVSAPSSGFSLGLNNGPCLLGANDPNNGSKTYVEVVVATSVPTFWATMMNQHTAAGSLCQG